MKERKRSRGWSRFALVALLALGLAAPAGLLLNMALPAPASANQELHPGGRLFFPAWDVRGARLSFMIITRLALFPFDQNESGGYINASKFYSPDNNCRPGHSTPFPFDGPGTASDDVHLEWYGKNCDASNEVIEMSCADIDLIFLSAATKTAHANVIDDQGSLDVHFVINGSNNFQQRVLENSLMGVGIVADPTEGWAYAYPAASAKATTCFFCAAASGGTPVGYEPFPVEVFIPFALADDSQGGLQNELYLWGPTFLPGDIMPAQLAISWNWFDGRERRFNESSQRHAFVDRLKNLDPLFKHSTFTCGHTNDFDKAENDGASRTNVNGVDATGGCSGNGGLDATHPSDDTQTLSKGFTSTSIGWWDILKVGETPTPLSENPLGFLVSKRGLVGVVAATIPGGGSGNGDAIRLWHKDPCEFAPQGSLGPPHLRDWAFQGQSDSLVAFNLFPANSGLGIDQEDICEGLHGDL